ncbi:unnamed protein product [Paramecium octaurelia]|uniref:Uncharacterized protein n=1 Tax=Paramecium octaurelia TaxID=43137 RepID=A0A8S1S378_PAROT|nr:unnamed protein product [Paramecium octaurelia]
MDYKRGLKFHKLDMVGEFSSFRYTQKTLQRMKAVGLVQIKHNLNSNSRRNHDTFCVNQRILYDGVKRLEFIKEEQQNIEVIPFNIQWFHSFIPKEFMSQNMSMALQNNN